MSDLSLGFALEYSLGHTTHAENLKRFIGDGASRSVSPVFVDVPYHQTPIGILAKLPGFRSNWSLRASCRAFLGLRQAAAHLDAALFHTQVTSLFSAGLMRSLPSVISLDATPLQYDTIGSHYNHAPSGNSMLESLKKRVNERAFRAAKRLVSWSEWTKNSLIHDYHVPAEKIAVIPPGIDLHRWKPVEKSNDRKSLNILFVGGDFIRKGGDTLLAAITQYYTGSSSVHLHVVTRSEVTVPEGAPVTIHRGLEPNCERLQQLYADADAFVFPTRADCLPLAVLEAMASGIPVITTRIGALPEAIGDGESGLVVPVDDPQSLAQAIETLANSPELRRQYGKRARQIAEERFDGATNYARLLKLVASTAKGRNECEHYS